MKIELRSGAKKFARQIPFVYCEKAEEITDMLERIGDRPTKWCHPMIVCPKKDREVRVPIDLTKLNCQVKRTVHNAKTAYSIVSEIKLGSKN